MSTPVVTVAAGGIPVVDTTATLKTGLPVTEALNGRGTAVTKVSTGGAPVTYVVVSTTGGLPP
jgi:hypothetical protein